MIEVYAELLLLENLIINFFILVLASKIVGVSINKKKLILGATIGAIYSFVFFIPSVHFLYSTIMKIAFSCLIVSVSYRPNNIRTFLKLMLAFYFVSFALGGMVLAAIYFTDFSGIVQNNIFYIREISYTKLLVLILLGYLTLRYLSRIFKSRLFRNELTAEIMIEIDNKRTSLKGIVDTANFLMDPLSQMPVIVVQYSALENFLPEVFKDILKDGIILEKIPDNIYEIGWGKRLRFIPYSSLGANNGMLIGVKPDVISIIRNNKQYFINNAIIGIYEGTIHRDGDYSALLHPDILKEEAAYEIKKVWNE